VGEWDASIHVIRNCYKRTVGFQTHFVRSKENSGLVMSLGNLVSVQLLLGSEKGLLCSRHLGIWPKWLSYVDRTLSK